MLNKQKLFVFPTSRAIRNFISNKEDGLLPFTLSIGDFLRKATKISNKKYIDESQRLLYLNEAVKDLNISKLGIDKNFTKFIKQSDYIYRFFLEISSEKIDIDEIKRWDTYEFYYEHIEILKEIQKRYLAILDENSCVDKINFSSNYEINKEFLEKFSSIELIFEGYFTKVEYEIIERIARYKDLNIEFYSNEYNQKSLEKFDFLKNDLKINYKYKINLSKKSILEEEKTKSKLEKLEIKGFSSRVNQIAYIKSIIVKSVNEGINPSKIVLVLPDENFTSMLELFDDERYFNYAMGKGIEKYNLYQVSLAIYNHLVDDEMKNIKNIEYLNIDKKFINDNIKARWNKTISKEAFKNICDFIKSFETNEEILEKFDEMIYKFFILMFSSNEPILLKDIYKIFLQNIKKIKIDDVHSGKITVMGLLETRASSFDTLIICDFNESFIPKISIKDKFLSTKIKQKASLPTSNDRENLQKYYYKRLINSSKNVYISYENSQENQISRFAYELFKKQEIDTSNDNLYKHILYNVSNINYLDKDLIDKIDLTKFIWSATSLKDFLSCRRKFYLKYILKIQEHSLSLKPKAFELGNIVHKVLENYYKDFGKKSIDELLNEYKEENPFLILDIELWKKKLYEFIKIEDKRIQNISILKLEQSFDFVYEGIRLKGVCDRIDKNNDTFEIIDYKTSSSLKVDSARNYEKSVDFQLEFYYLAINHLYKSDNIKTFYYDLNNNKLLEEIMLDKKLELLLKKFDEIKELSKEEINFSKCEDKLPCTFCPYLTICNRD